MHFYKNPVTGLDPVPAIIRASKQPHIPEFSKLNSAEQIELASCYRPALDTKSGTIDSVIRMYHGACL